MTRELNKSTRRELMKMSALTAAGLAIRAPDVLAEPLASRNDMVQLKHNAESSTIRRHANEFYVATSGDRNSGSETAPFRTLAKAQSAIRSIQPLRRSVTVWVRCGTYYLAEP